MRCTRAVSGRVVRRFYYLLRIMQKYNILELNEKLLPELQSIAEELGIKKVSSLKKE
ncbi:Rho termination factor N-terminal domain-containing protein, partial [uncultured Parabacteroides sp.]|uniref:Rho termination factor N-terminal domain-containing protein n=1 Tax=uncultured Parabacteroides sp. TaxID=512312 RepID=UPI00265B4693